ncbi:MAG: peptide deformylase [Actinobacteria bacterium]|nr:peptide deformylase [Actinomycetota bacterium]
MAERASTAEAPELEAPLEAEAPEASAGLDPERAERRSAALAQLVKFGDPVLRSVASPVTDFGSALEAEAERMAELMKDGMGVGLAATQLGILRRILVLQAGPDAPVTALVNPAIEWSSRDDLVTAEEGCLSIPGVVLDVERPLRVGVSAVDTAGAPLTIEASGLEARVIQHEIDHLDGVLILQRAPRDQRRAALRALREGGTYAPEREHDQPEDGEPEDPGGRAPRRGDPRA